MFQFTNFSISSFFNFSGIRIFYFSSDFSFFVISVSEFFNFSIFQFFDIPFVQFFEFSVFWFFETIFCFDFLTSRFFDFYNFLTFQQVSCVNFSTFRISTKWVNFGQILPDFPFSDFRIRNIHVKLIIHESVSQTNISPHTARTNPLNMQHLINTQRVVFEICTYIENPPLS